MNNMKQPEYDNDTCFDGGFEDASDDADSVMSECIPEEDGEISSADDGSPAAAADENAALLKRVEDLTSAYLTLAADFENYKKRNQKHMEEVKKFAGEPIMLDMIEVADNFERAIASAEKTASDKESLMEGVKNTYRQFMTYLEAHGLSKIPAESGMEFDPHLHESVAQIPTAEYPDETILEVFKPGYTLNNKVIRPATVTISAHTDET